MLRTPAPHTSALGVTSKPGDNHTVSNESTFGAISFECPHCRTVAQHSWFGQDVAFRALFAILQHMYFNYRRHIKDYQQEAIAGFLSELNNKLPREVESLISASFAVAVCEACDDPSLWINRQLVYPITTNIDPPNKDLNEEIRGLYAEAASICAASPKGAAALLRLALQKLMVQLGKDGKNINTNIKELVADGLSPKIQ